MLIGAAALIRAWGRPMTLSRQGVVLVSFLGRKYEVTQHNSHAHILDYSVEQEIMFVVVAAEDLLGVEPQKFDVITFESNGTQYTVQRGHTAGAEVDEVVRILIKGGQV